jgi:F420-dependent methylenetetrahydromethanopterin dehydrogenase
LQKTSILSQAELGTTYGTAKVEAALRAATASVKVTIEGCMVMKDECPAQV